MIAFCPGFGTLPVTVPCATGSNFTKAATVRLLGDCLMSIYATLWSIQVQDPAAPLTSPKWVTVTAQAVPPQIGSPTPGCGYEDGDPYADFLPPPIETDDLGHAAYNRAVVFITGKTKKGTNRSGQEYADSLLILTGEAYAKMPFDKLLTALQEAVRSRQASAVTGALHVYFCGLFSIICAVTVGSESAWPTLDYFVAQSTSIDPRSLLALEASPGLKMVTSTTGC